MERTLEKEFILYKCMKVFEYTVNKINKYNKDLGIIDLPEFAKLPQDTINHQADMYIVKLIKENRLDDEFKKIINV